MSAHLDIAFRDAVDRHGVLLVHDQELPSITSVAVGEPIHGSWWSHPMANDIYNALGAIEDHVLRVKLICKKDTLVAQRVWPAILAIGLSRSAWQLKGVTAGALRLLDEIELAPDALIVERADREHAKVLASRLLVHVDEVHSSAGHHVKTFNSWHRWATDHDIEPSGLNDATDLIEGLIAAWPSVEIRRLLPW